MFSIPPGVVNITARPVLRWKDRIGRSLQELTKAGPDRDYLRSLLISAGVTAVLALAVYFLIPALGGLVIACCSGLIFLAVRAIIAEDAACRSLVRHINGRRRQIVDAQSSSLTEVLRRIERECIENAPPRLATFNSQLADFIVAIEPTTVSASPYQSLNPLKFIQARTAYSSRLFVDSDTIVRLSLFLTFATLTWALYEAAIELPQVGTQVQDSAAKANGLVRDLINAASLKFTISAVGLGLSIILRFWARAQEGMVARAISVLSSESFQVIDKFLKQRASGTLRVSERDNRSLSDLLAELIQVVRGNSEVHREISNAISGFPRNA